MFLAVTSLARSRKIMPCVRCYENSLRFSKLRKCIVAENDVNAELIMKKMRSHF